MDRKLLLNKLVLLLFILVCGSKTFAQQTFEATSNPIIVEIPVVDATEVYEIISPFVVEGEKFVTSKSLLEIKGKILDIKKQPKLMINGEVVNYDIKSGLFAHKVQVPYMDSKVKIEVVTSKKTYTTNIAVFKPLDREDLATVNQARNGKDYALLFATNEYAEFGQLMNPVFDANTIAGELHDLFGFETKVILNPSLDSIYAVLKEYGSKEYRDGDQLFIFFAGHGEFDKTFNDGYIVASDSRKSRSSMVSHSNLNTIINHVPCKHIFLVMDVCFGGTFAYVAHRGGEDHSTADKSAYITRKMKYKTRQYLTSGGEEYVPDGRPGHHSPFARRFLEALRTGGNEFGVLSIKDIMGYVELATPEPKNGGFGDNEPGSDFLFIRK